MHFNWHWHSVLIHFEAPHTAHNLLSTHFSCHWVMVVVGVGVKQMKQQPSHKFSPQNITKLSFNVKKESCASTLILRTKLFVRACRRLLNAARAGWIGRCERQSTYDYEWPRGLQACDGGRYQEPVGWLSSCSIYAHVACLECIIQYINSFFIIIK